MIDYGYIAIELLVFALMIYGIVKLPERRKWMGIVGMAAFWLAYVFVSLVIASG